MAANSCMDLFYFLTSNDLHAFVISKRAQRIERSSQYITKRTVREYLTISIKIFRPISILN